MKLVLKFGFEENWEEDSERSNEAYFGDDESLRLSSALSGGGHIKNERRQLGLFDSDLETSSEKDVKSDSQRSDSSTPKTSDDNNKEKKKRTINVEDKQQSGWKCYQKELAQTESSASESKSKESKRKNGSSSESTGDTKFNFNTCAPTEPKSSGFYTKSVHASLSREQYLQIFEQAKRDNHFQGIHPVKHPKSGHIDRYFITDGCLFDKNFFIEMNVSNIMKEIEEVAKLTGLRQYFFYDTSFQFGDFYLSPLVWHHPLLNRNIMVGALIHRSKEQKLHKKFLRNFYQTHKKRLRDILVTFITDEEFHLDRIWPNATQLFCSLHLMRNMKRALEKIGTNGEQLNELVQKFRTLRDCQSFAEFDALMDVYDKEEFTSEAEKKVFCSYKTTALL
uniref:MULE transposase domain-containing protein n=1 Tax=Panagrolaimus sp. ES5 TaxID=591445 RepID=A0AC34F115_9BILA